MVLVSYSIMAFGRGNQTTPWRGVYFFTNGVYQDFHHNIMFQWFLNYKTTVGKKMHTLPRCGLIFPFQMPYFLHWLFSSPLLTQLKPPEASEQAAKKVEGAALKLPPGLTRPGPCEPKFWKNDLPANLFLLCVLKLPQKCNKFTPAF